MRSSGFVFNRAARSGTESSSRRCAADLCSCLMILSPAGGCFAEDATDPEKLLKTGSRLLE